jgi:hypothetical protein
MAAQFVYFTPRQWKKQEEARVYGLISVFVEKGIALFILFCYHFLC